MNITVCPESTRTFPRLCLPLASFAGGGRNKLLDTSLDLLSLTYITFFKVSLNYHMDARFLYSCVFIRCPQALQILRWTNTCRTPLTYIIFHYPVFSSSIQNRMYEIIIRMGYSFVFVLIKINCYTNIKQVWS